VVKYSFPRQATNDTIQDLVRTNIIVLSKLYDKDQGAFNHRIYINDLPTRMLSKLHDPFASFFLRSTLLHSVASGHAEVRIDSKKDLKDQGLACVGLSKYLLLTKSSDTRLLSMQRSGLDYLMHHQGASGALLCRYIRSNTMKYGTDERSIIETTIAFLWAIAASLELYQDDERYTKKLVERARRAVTWLKCNSKSPTPQETGRLIYGLSELHVETQEESHILWIRRLAEGLVLRLGDFESFDCFPNDIDSVGGLSLASLITGQKVFVDVASRLVRNQLANQGVKGEWRWSFNRRTGHYRRLIDLTFSVHQLGMGPWALSQYLLAVNHDSYSTAERVLKGILWIIARKAFTSDFIVRSYSGLTGGIYELEQRSYEPGLNVLGLLSFSSIRQLRRIAIR
jgi:hypothetical protein